MSQLIIAGDAPAITSREIAELVDSRHDKVKQSIERLVQRGVIVQPPLGDEPSTDAMGRSRPRQVYVFAGVQGKRDSIVVVAQLSPEFTAQARSQSRVMWGLSVPAVSWGCTSAAHFETGERAVVALSGGRHVITSRYLGGRGL